MPPILCYHKIDTRLELGFTRLGPAVFRRQMQALAAAGYRTAGSESLSRPTTHDSRPTVVITFDDAYDALDRHAFPLLADLGFQALVFVITDYAGRENTWDVQYGWRRFHHLDWDLLGRWQEKGIEVHSHGCTHARLTWLGDAQVADELGRSRETIRQRLGKAPAGISYPFGAADGRVRRLAEQAGYLLGFAGPGDNGEDLLMLHRRPVYAWDRFAPPLVAREGPAGALAKSVALLTNRCSVGTAAIQRLLRRRYAG